MFVMEKLHTIHNSPIVMVSYLKKTFMNLHKGSGGYHRDVVSQYCAATPGDLPPSLA